MQGPAEHPRIALSARLQARRAEIEQITLTRIYGISGPSEAVDAEYAEGLRAAVSAAIEYALVAIEHSEACSPAIPAVLLTQARLAARNGVSLDTVLRRYLAGYTLLGDFLIQEAEKAELRGSALQEMLRGQAVVLDHLLAVVTVEYSRAERERPLTSEQRRTKHVQRLLAGELVDTTALAYDFDAHHIGVVACGPGAADAMRSLAEALDRRLLLVQHREHTLWAWLGGRKRLDAIAVERELSEVWRSEIPIAIGEPARHLEGWRLTHRQAVAALPVAQRTPGSATHYADVALLASVLKDDLLASSLKQLYLEPLEKERDGGAAARETLRAYFTADRNISSAAATLGVNRNTVASRLRLVEDRIGRPLGTCAGIETALRLMELDESPVSADHLADR